MTLQTGFGKLGFCKFRLLLPFDHPTAIATHLVSWVQELEGDKKSIFLLL